MVGSIVEDLLEGIVEAMRATALALLNTIIAMIKNAPEPDLTSGSWFFDPYSNMIELGIWLSVPFILVATIYAVFKGGLGDVLKTYLVAVPVAVLGGIAIIALMGLIQSITDGLTNAALGQMRSDFDAYYNALDRGTADALDAMMWQVLMYATVIVATVFLLLELIVRCIGIYMAILFVPLALGAATLKTARGWAMRLIETSIVLIASKFIIVAVLSFGFAVIRSSVPLTGETMNPAEMTSTLIVGVITIFMATVGTPLLLAMVLSPSNSDSATSRKALQSTSPIDADNQYVRGLYKSAGKSLIKGGKGGK
jgi:hypothetical protein